MNDDALRYGADTPLSRRVVAMRSSAIRDLLGDAQRPGMLSLAGGLPAADQFDVEGIERAFAQAMREAPRVALQYGATEGQPSLREALASLMAQRGAAVAPDDVVVTAGSQQALDLLARALLDPGDLVALERPSYLAALQAFALSGARFVAVSGDGDGACVERLLAAPGPAPKLVYLVTNFANPTGATLSLARRRALLDWAVRRRVVVVEDDPYGELRVEGAALPPLVALARDTPGAAHWCAYVSTLSKVVSPGLRIGFAVLPGWLRDAVVRVKQALDLQTGSLAQEVADRYLRSGRLAQRLPQLRASYRERRDALCDALAARFGDGLRFARPEGGMFVWARFTDGTDASALLAAARDEGTIFVPGAAFYDGAPDAAALRLSFATLAPPQLAEAVERLARAHRRLGGCDPTALAKREAGATPAH
ncbi:MAG: PLP-dependent aminotransferase family protein [Burkholderiaceae bacterium]|nr:PLP-dependent aminotransferase family protein [Burkholderiaceae bacterium]